MTARIVWLASYPKSGNTWLRIFLSNLTHQGTAPIDFNDLPHSTDSSDRQMFDRVLGFDTADLDRDACARLRPAVYRWMNAQLTDVIYCKAHDACVQVPGGDWLMAPDATDRVVYVLRNPLDVAVSMAHHLQRSLDAMIESLGDPDAVLAGQMPGKQNDQVEQPLGTWSAHVAGWTESALFKTCVVRYEDLHAAPHQTFGRIAHFLSLPDAGAPLDHAIEQAAFDRLYQQESETRFREAPQNVERFFRRGKIGDWQEALSLRQIDKIVKDHLPLMQKFGYAEADGTPKLS